MPFRSKKQMRFLYARKPEVAKRWASEYDVPEDLPATVKIRKKALKKASEKE